MANEFTKSKVNGNTIWKCNQCGEEIISGTKPRNHACFVVVEDEFEEEQVSQGIHSQNSNLQQHGPVQGAVGLQLWPPQSQQQQGFSRFSTPGIPQVTIARSQSTPRFSRGRGRSGGFRRGSSGGNSDMNTFMEMFQQQQQMMIQNQQQFMEHQRQQQDMIMQTINSFQRNERSADRINVPSKKIKCPKWENKETFKSFSDCLRIWNDIEKGPGKYLDLIDSLQSTGKHKEKEKIELEA